MSISVSFFVLGICVSASSGGVPPGFVAVTKNGVIVTSDGEPVYIPE